DLAHRAGLGFSCFVSIGAAADVSSNDLLEWWEDDPETGVVLLYLESFGNPRNFGRIARRVGARKPVVAGTPGGAGARGAPLAPAGGGPPPPPPGAFAARPGRGEHPGGPAGRRGGLGEERDSPGQAPRGGRRRRRPAQGGVVRADAGRAAGRGHRAATGGGGAGRGGPAADRRSRRLPGRAE